MNFKSEIPRESLIRELRRIANLLIKVPSMKEYNRYSEIGKAVTCEKKFGGWKSFLIAAGFEPNASRKIHSNDELENDFRRIATALGHTPTTLEFDKHSKAGKSGTFALRFGKGKWDKACVSLGFAPPKHIPPSIIGGWNKGITHVKVNLDELRHLYETEGMSMSAIANKLGVNLKTIRRRMDQCGIKIKKHHYTQPRQTLPETLLYKELERQRIPFMKQQPIDGLYVVDALVPGAKIAIECDGDYWHRPEDKSIAQRDQKKTKYLESRGYKVFRFWESEIKAGAQQCVDKVSEIWKKYKG